MMAPCDGTFGGRQKAYEKGIVVYIELFITAVNKSSRRRLLEEWEV
jgi:hypothetical protein